MSPAVPSLPPVVVTRAETRDGVLSSQLRELGLTVLLWPAVHIAAADSGALEQALARIGDFDWIVFASRHAVAAIAACHPQLPENVRVAAVGRATAEVLRRRGFRVDLLPGDSNMGSLVHAFAALGCAGAQILYPASSRALPTLSQGLSQLGAHVTQVEAYRTEAAALDVSDCRDWIDRRIIGAVTFASPSAVIELERALGRADFGRLTSQAAVVAIGPTTARALTERGSTPVLAQTATLAGLANTTFRLLQTRP